MQERCSMYLVKVNWTSFRNQTFHAKLIIVIFVLWNKYIVMPMLNAPMLTWFFVQYLALLNTSLPIHCYANFCGWYILFLVNVGWPDITRTTSDSVLIGMEKRFTTMVKLCMGFNILLVVSRSKRIGPQSVSRPWMPSSQSNWFLRSNKLLQKPV